MKQYNKIKTPDNDIREFDLGIITKENDTVEKLIVACIICSFIVALGVLIAHMYVLHEQYTKQIAKDLEMNTNLAVEQVKEHEKIVEEHDRIVEKIQDTFIIIEKKGVQPGPQGVDG